MDNIILDSDFIFGFFNESDANHDKSKKLFELIEGQNLIILNITRFEVITLISRRTSQEFAKLVLEELEGFIPQIFFVDQKIDSEIWEEFDRHSKKNISLVDCANLVYARKLNAKIASFDTFYPQELLVQL